MKRKIASLFLSTILLSTALTGCSSKGAENNKSEGKDTIVYSMNTAPQGIFNPLISNLAMDHYVESVVYASLMTVNDKGELETYLADEYEVSDAKMGAYAMVKPEKTLVGSWQFSDIKGNPLPIEELEY